MVSISGSNRVIQAVLRGRIAPQIRLNTSVCNQPPIAERANALRGFNTTSRFDAVKPKKMHAQ